MTTRIQQRYIRLGPLNTREYNKLSHAAKASGYDDVYEFLTNLIGQLWSSDEKDVRFVLVGLREDTYDTYKQFYGGDASNIPNCIASYAEDGAADFADAIRTAKKGQIDYRLLVGDEGTEGVD